MYIYFEYGEMGTHGYPLEQGGGKKTCSKERMGWEQ